MSYRPTLTKGSFVCRKKSRYRVREKPAKFKLAPLLKAKMKRAPPPLHKNEALKALQKSRAAAAASRTAKPPPPPTREGATAQESDEGSFFSQQRRNSVRPEVLADAEYAFDYRV